MFFFVFLTYVTLFLTFFKHFLQNFSKDFYFKKLLLLFFSLFFSPFLQSATFRVMVLLWALISTGREPAERSHRGDTCIGARGPHLFDWYKGGRFSFGQVRRGSDSLPQA